MIPLLHAALTTLIVLSVNIFTKTKLKYYVYLILFLLIAGSGYLSKAYASEIDWRNEHHYIFRSIMIETKDERKEEEKPKKISKKDFLKDKIRYHRESCKECYINAEKCTVFFPNLDEKDKADHCFR